MDEKVKSHFKVAKKRDGDYNKKKEVSGENCGCRSIG
jgi:hypothetical protein